MINKKWIVLFLSIILFVSPITAFADAAPGDVIITLGEDLTDEERQSLLKEMEAPENPEIVFVSNKEEHQYLGDYISKAQIGTRALSSSKITIGEKGTGLIIDTNKINWVTKEMYANALTTAGVEDAEIYITAPVAVSGTAALTGIIKAYEISADIKIPEEQKQVANEEMVQTAKLGDKIGAEKASEFMSKIKEEIAKNEPKTEEELRALIQNVAGELGITLSESELSALVDLFNKMKNLDINWDKVNEQLNKAKENIESFLNSDEGQTIMQKLGRFFQKVADWIASLFG